MPKQAGQGRQVEAGHSQLQEKKVHDLLQQEVTIQWSDLIFLPFHPVFRMFILILVLIKATLGPIQSVYPIVYCDNTMDRNLFTILIKYCYWYVCDFFYGIDTFLHIAHRQVSDKAMRKEHLPKPAFYLMLDLITLIPFRRLTEPDPCPKAALWPNLLAFNEFVIIYRVTQYFSLFKTHSFWKIMIGYTIVMALCINAIVCLWLLFTEYGFCNRCREPNTYFDWRAFTMNMINGTATSYTTYVSGLSFILSFAVNKQFDTTKPSAILEFKLICILMVAGYLLQYFIVMPKSFAESLLRLRRVSIKYPAVKKIIEDTKRRNPSSDCHKQVELYYKLLWKKRHGIVHTPDVLFIIPGYVKLDVKQDLLWPLFYHSPTLRHTSTSFRRWLNEFIEISYKLPGEHFFVGNQSCTNLYYLKSGIVQLISVDDGVTPILSVTSGTIFGDINFFVPHLKRKVLVRCLTYCEIYFVKRIYMLRALYKYPYDKKNIIVTANERIEHAKLLFNNKQHISGLDRNEDEGIAWIKKRWWEIFEVVYTSNKQAGSVGRNLAKDYVLHEQTIYHCAKYIGLIVLCTRTELTTKSMFSRLKFPWILNPQSNFGFVWHRIVLITVIVVLFVYPPNLIKSERPHWFTFLTYWCDTIYVLDILLSFFTAVKSHTTDYATVMFERCKSFTFMLDLLSTLWIEEIAVIAGVPEYYNLLQFNRLIKIYRLFYGDYLKWEIHENPMVSVFTNVTLINFASKFIVSHIMFECFYYVPKLTMEYFFGEKLCLRAQNTDCQKIDNFARVTISWEFEWYYSENPPSTLKDLYVAMGLGYVYYLMSVYCNGRFVAYLYLRYKNIIKYQSFVSRLQDYYQYHAIHQDLLKRLERYLTCHWKYYKGIEVMSSKTLSDEPNEVYWLASAQVAEKVIRESNAFMNANPKLIRKLAVAAKFLILPKHVTVLMFGHTSKTVAWLVQGSIKYEYHDDNGQMHTVYNGPGTILSICAVFFHKPSLRSCTTITDCEILYIPLKEFFKIYKEFELEWSYLENCKKEFGERFDALFLNYILRHREDQIKLRDELNTKKMAMATSGILADIKENRYLTFEGVFWGSPTSRTALRWFCLLFGFYCIWNYVWASRTLSCRLHRFMKSWMLFRAIIVCVSIISASALGGVGVFYRVVFLAIGAFCDCIAWIDIFIKLFIPYTDSNGILITDKKKCFLNYASKAFVLDLIGAYSWYNILTILLSQGIEDETCFLINTLCKFAHIYILFAYFDYITDVPSVNVILIKILKWQIVNILIVLGISHYLMVNCVHFEFKGTILQEVVLRNSCWMPTFFRLPRKLNRNQLHLIFAQSLNLAEGGMMRINFGRFSVDRKNIGVGLVLFLLGIIFWFITGYTQTLLVLHGRGNTIFQHGVQSLRKFLMSERVDKRIIETAMDHFRYCWMRTKGADLQQIAHDRISVSFRQDISYFFYKKTFRILDTLLGGGEVVQTELAGVCLQAFYLPGQDITREMDLLSTVCIVHRGIVNVIKNGKKIMILTKGNIFGQLLDKKLRPVRITATSHSHVDLLIIDVSVFQQIITDQVRKKIASNPQSKYDFMATKSIYVENPYDSVKYILRGNKAILPPWSKDATDAVYGTWYANWLYVSWFIGPILSTSSVIVFNILPPNSFLWFRIYCVLYFTDFLHLIHFISEFYTIELVVDKRKCVPRRAGWSELKKVHFYLDLLSLLIPLLTIVIPDWRFQLARILRLKWLFDFDKHFCRTFKSRATPVILKFSILLLILHVFTCGWIYFACRDEKFPIPDPDLHHMNNTIDFSQWQHPDDRGGLGCARVTRDINYDEGGKGPAFVVPKHWLNDYYVAMTYILLIQTNHSVDSVIAISLNQIYYKIIVTFFMYLLNMWIMAVAINVAYTKFRELYHYEYLVQELIIYLRDFGICKSLQDSVLEYTTHLWERENGNWLPELAYQAPPCLCQDLFSALYMHHLEVPPSFRNLPIYFKRQLVARLKRIVAFPGKCIIREGDAFNSIYFIHEGEVEKWFTDSKGDAKLFSVMYTNAYFGCISGMFPGDQFQFSYYARTVVDLVYLDLSNWRDLLDAYPDVKVELYKDTLRMKKEFTDIGKWISVARSLLLTSCHVLSLLVYPFYILRKNIYLLSR